MHIILLIISISSFYSLRIYNKAAEEEQKTYVFKGIRDMDLETSEITWKSNVRQGHDLESNA